MPRSLLLAAALLTTIQAANAQAQPATWTQVGMLTCKLNPSIGFVIFGHQSMECRFVQNPPLPTQAYEGALNTVGANTAQPSTPPAVTPRSRPTVLSAPS